MRIGILSDTHDHQVNTRIALSMLRNLKACVVLHAGDYCAPFMIPMFENWELHGVFGNNDGDHYRIQQKFHSIGAHLHGEFMSHEFDGKRIAMYHGTQPEITESLLRGGLYDVVVTGHTHQSVNKVWHHPVFEYGKALHRHVEREEDPEDRPSSIEFLRPQTLHINPGTVNGLGGPATFAFYDTDTGYAEIVGL